MIVDNAVIMAAGTSSRFAPLSYEKPKALIEVKGEVLIERQIRQLKDSGIKEIYIVTGYMAEQFDYLKEKYGVCLIHNPFYLSRNNNSSIWVARNVIKNTYICSADNYFSINPFEKEVNDAYYAGVFTDGYTEEWCMQEDADGNIISVHVGGEKSWYMLGHTFWSECFSNQFLKILEQEYDFPETADKLWEQIFIEHLDVLKMKIKKYAPSDIYEFDTLDELREFDVSYKSNSRSLILKNVANRLQVFEADIMEIKTIKGNDTAAIGFEFSALGKRYYYYYDSKEIISMK